MVYREAYAEYCPPELYAGSVTAKSASPSYHDRAEDAAYIGGRDTQTVRRGTHSGTNPT